MRTSGGKRFDSSEARERCVSNGPQGEPRSGESSSITDQIQKPCSMSRVFLYLKSDEDENLRGQEVRPERSERTLRQQRPAGRATQWRVILYHRPNSETLLNEQGFLYLKPDEDENLRGQEVRLERSERTLRQQQPAGRATLYHRQVDALTTSSGMIPSLWLTFLPASKSNNSVIACRATSSRCIFTAVSGGSDSRARIPS